MSLTFWDFSDEIGGDNNMWFKKKMFYNEMVA